MGCAGFLGALFVALLLATALPAWLCVAATDACRCCLRRCCRRQQPSPAGDGFAQRMAWLLRQGWRVAFCLCCWLRIDSGVPGALREAGGAGRSVCIMGNHTSFMDTPVVLVVLPWRLLRNLRAMAMNKVFKMPLIGRLARAQGHFPVHFKSGEQGNFAVDRDKMADVMAGLDRYLEGGGNLLIFPEGHINQDWRQVKEFRVGGIEICIKHDLEIWALVMTGNATAWPKGTLCGGGPARLRSHAVLLHASAKEASEALAPGAELRAQAVALADSCRARMQEALDEMLAAAGGPREKGAATPGDATKVWPQPASSEAP